MQRAGLSLGLRYQGRSAHPFLPRIDPRRVLYYGRGSTKAEALNKYDIDEVRYVDELRDFIVDWAGSLKGSVLLLDRSQALRIPDFQGTVDVRSLKPAMNLARMIKDQHEVKLIKKANDISSIAHREVLANVRKFKNEAQVEGLFLNVCISKLAKEQAYDPIAASGPNAGTLHYAANNEDFEDRQLLCLDAGCEYELYASDITRTIPLSGYWPSKEAEQIYRLVERMQETCIERLAPGVRYLDVHILAHQIAIDGLLSLGILHNGTREEIFKAGTSRAFFPHGLGHHVGLEVHDVMHVPIQMVNKLQEKEPAVNVLENTILHGLSHFDRIIQYLAFHHHTMLFSLVAFRLVLLTSLIVISTIIKYDFIFHIAALVVF